MLNQLRLIIHYREAIRNFVTRDLKVRYSNSALGILWSLLNPLLMTAIFTIVFAYLLPNRIDHFPVYLMSGLLPWNFFSASLLTTAQSITGNAHLVGRVYFPREILPISIVLANAIHFLFALVPLFLLMGLFQTPITLWLLCLPILLGLQIIFSLGLGFLLSALNVYFRDLQQVLDILVQGLFFLTPIFYDLGANTSPLIRQIVLIANPVASLIVNYRHILYSGQGPDGGLLALTTLQAMVILIIGLLVFNRLSPNFAEEL